MKKSNFVSAKGARLLRRVAKHILAQPLRYNQNTIVTIGEPRERVLDINAKEQVVPECGTVACIGGWLSILTETPLGSYGHLRFDRLSALIGVDEADMGRLCEYTQVGGNVRYGWPAKFADAYNKAKTAKTRAKIAANRIEHFIKTGE